VGNILAAGSDCVLAKEYILSLIPALCNVVPHSRNKDCRGICSDSVPCPSRFSRTEVMVLVAECRRAADRGQHLLAGTGVAADQDLPARVEGVSLHRGKATGDTKGTGLGCRGIADVRDTPGNGVVDKRGGIGARSSVHDVQIRGGPAGAPIMGTSDAGKYRLAVIGVDQLAGAVEAGVQRASAVLHGNRQRRRLRRRTVLGALGERETRQDHVRKVGVGAAETDIEDFRRRAGTVDAVHGVFDDSVGAEDGVEAAGAADLAHQHQAGQRGVIDAAHEDRAAVSRTLVDHRTAIQRGGIIAVWGGDGDNSRRGAAAVETGVQGGGAGAAGRRDQAFNDSHRAAGRHFLPDDDDVAGAGIEAQTCEFIASVGAGGEGADVTVGAECGVNRAVPGAANDVVRPQVTGGGGTGWYRAAACREGAPGTAHTDVRVGLLQGINLLAVIARVNRHAGTVALSGGGGAGVGL
jgi:hypothetical protein